MNKICIGDMRDRVAIYTRSIVRGATGETETWTLDATFWAKVSNLTTKKKVWLGSFFKDVTHIFDFQGDLSYTMEDTKFIFDSKTYFMVTPGEHSETGQPEMTEYLVREGIL